MLMSSVYRVPRSTHSFQPNEDLCQHIGLGMVCVCVCICQYSEFHLPLTVRCCVIVCWWKDLWFCTLHVPQPVSQMLVVISSTFNTFTMRTYNFWPWPSWSRTLFAIRTKIIIIEMRGDSLSFCPCSHLPSTGYCRNLGCTRCVFYGRKSVFHCTESATASTCGIGTPSSVPWRTAGKVEWPFA